MNDIFCKIINKEMESRIFYEDDICLGIMDAFPSSPGHALVIPKKHYTDILEFDDNELMHVYSIGKKFIGKMETCYPNFDGAHITVNYGKDQMIKHFHLHLIPTYKSKVKLTQDEACILLKNTN